MALNSFEARLLHGSPLMVDHTPSGSDVDAGAVVVIGAVPFVAHDDIKDGVKGSLAARGGVYRLTGDDEHTEGTKVYWDDTAKKITVGTGEHPHFGYVAPGGGSAADDDPVDVIHAPDGTATAEAQE